MGPMIVATNLSTWSVMRDQIGEASAVRKEYIALMHGWLPASMQSGTIKHPLKTFTSKWGRGFRTVVDPYGKPAETRYKVIEHYSCEETRRLYTLLRIRIFSGRTHQIRVHVRQLAYEMGLQSCGLVGDYKYLPPAQ